MARAQGVWMYDAAGTRYMDCYNNVVSVGHVHPYVAEAIVRQLRTLNTNTRYLTELSTAYAERLVATLDPSLDSVLYVNSGSEANDLAYRLSKAWTGHTGGLTMEFGYHGITDAIFHFTPSTIRDPIKTPLAPHMRTLVPPDDFRGPFRRGSPLLGERYAELVDAPIAQLSAPGAAGLACAMIDSLFMSNGVLDVPRPYLQLVCSKVRAAGGLFIADEVQSGFGRTGAALWGHQHHGIVPDIVTLGKPAGNGHPLGVVITRKEILDHFTSQVGFFSTFGGNSVSCAAGIAVLDVIRDEGLVQNAHVVGAYLKAGLEKLLSKYPIMGDVRGVGLGLGIELVRDRHTLEPAKEETAQLLLLLRDEGLLVGSEGSSDNCVKIRPPLIFTLENADHALACFDRAFDKLALSRRG